MWRWATSGSPNIAAAHRSRCRLHRGVQVQPRGRAGVPVFVRYEVVLIDIVERDTAGECALRGNAPDFASRTPPLGVVSMLSQDYVATGATGTGGPGVHRSRRARRPPHTASRARTARRPTSPYSSASGWIGCHTCTTRPRTETGCRIGKAPGATRFNACVAFSVLPIVRVVLR